MTERVIEYKKYDVDVAATLPQRMKRHGKYERRRDARVSPSDLRHLSREEFMEVAKDKWKSRSLQRSLMESDYEVCKLIHEKAEPIFVELLSDQYGNYLVQKILEHCSDDGFDRVFNKLKHKLQELASEVHGTRAVQKFVEEGIKRGRGDEVLASLIEHVEPLSRSVTGFHVVVKLLEKLPPAKVNMVIERLLRNSKESVVRMGKDQWGCCVLKACIDRGSGNGLKMIIDAATENVLHLVEDPYGNYVIQHVLNHVTEGRNSELTQNVLADMIAQVKDHVLDLCQQKFGSNVLEKLLKTAKSESRAQLIDGVLNADKGFDATKAASSLLFHQYGNYVLQQTLAVAEGKQKEILENALKPTVQSILRSMMSGRPSVTRPTGSPSTVQLAPDQAQRLCMKLAKKVPALLEGMEPNEKVLLSTPNLSSDDERSCDGNAHPDAGTNNKTKLALGDTPDGNSNTSSNQQMMTSQQLSPNLYNPYTATAAATAAAAATATAYQHAAGYYQKAAYGSPYQQSFGGVMGDHMTSAYHGSPYQQNGYNQNATTWAGYNGMQSSPYGNGTYQSQTGTYQSPAGTYQSPAGTYQSPAGTYGQHQSPAGASSFWPYYPTYASPQQQ